MGLSLPGILLAQDRQTHTMTIVGLAPGRTLRLKIANDQPRNQPSGRVRILARNSRGEIVKETQDTAVPAGESRSFSFSLDDLKSQGEPGISSNFEIQFSIGDLTPAEISRILQISAELVEDSTGKADSLVSRSSSQAAGGPACWQFCTSLFCINVCLHPFASFVTPNYPSN
jgi:hypothetical protein